MDELLQPSTRELLTWIASRPRSYAEAMEAWRSTCPRHSVWEDALADGLVRVVRANGASTVALTTRGRTLLEQRVTATPTPPPLP